MRGKEREISVDPSHKPSCTLPHVVVSGGEDERYRMVWGERILVQQTIKPYVEGMIA